MKEFFQKLMTIVMVVTVSIGFASCGSYSDEDEIEVDTETVVKNLTEHMWLGQTTDGTYRDTYFVYFTSDHEGIMHIRSVDNDPSLGISRNEEHVDFTYTIDGNKIRLSGGSNFVFEYYGDYLLEGDTQLKPNSMTLDDDTYISDHKKGYHGVDGPIDIGFYVSNDNEILKGVDYLEGGWNAYALDIAYGANSADAYKKGVSEIKLTVWADNGGVNSTAPSDYGKTETYLSFLSETKNGDEVIMWITSKDAKITFHYTLEYYNKKDGEWYEIQSRTLTFYK